MVTGLKNAKLAEYILSFIPLYLQQYIIHQTFHSQKTTHRSVVGFMVAGRGVDVNKRTVACLQLAIGYKIWPLYEQLSNFFSFIGHILAKTKIGIIECVL